MTTLSNSHAGTWVLEATISAARAAAPQWAEQLDRIRAIALYDETTKTWRARLGALDVAGIQTLQVLFDAASAHGTQVRLKPVVVPAHWNGPTFTHAEVAALLQAQADRGRPLGQLPHP